MAAVEDHLGVRGFTQGVNMYFQVCFSASSSNLDTNVWRYADRNIREYPSVGGAEIPICLLIQIPKYLMT
jgi:hypothetical protein